MTLSWLSRQNGYKIAHGLLFHKGKHCAVAAFEPEGAGGAAVEIKRALNFEIAERRRQNFSQTSQRCFWTKCQRFAIAPIYRRECARGQASIIESAHFCSKIDKERSTLYRGIELFLSRKFGKTHDLNAARRRSEDTSKQTGGEQRKNKPAFDNSQSNRGEVRIEITAIHTGEAFRLFHRVRQILVATGIIDHAQRTRFRGENCKIDNRAVASLGVGKIDMSIDDIARGDRFMPRGQAPPFRRRGERREQEQK